MKSTTQRSGCQRRLDHAREAYEARAKREYASAALSGGTWVKAIVGGLLWLVGGYIFIVWLLSTGG